MTTFEDLQELLFSIIGKTPYALPKAYFNYLNIFSQLENISSDLKKYDLTLFATTGVPCLVRKE